MRRNRRPASRVHHPVAARQRRGEGEIEVFMMVRHHQIEFNSGALVFPGGSLDRGDQEIIANPTLWSGGEGLDAAALGFRIAAIRETFEESGILLARPPGSKALVDAKRAGEIEAAQPRCPVRGQDQFPNCSPTMSWCSRSMNSCPMRTGSRPRACPSDSTPGSSSRPRRRSRSAPMTARNPPIRSGCRRARRWRAARAAASSCRFRPRAT